MSNPCKYGRLIGQTYYLDLEHCSDAMLCEILFLDRSSYLAESIVLEIQKYPKVFRGKVKELCNRLYRKNGTALSPTSNEYVGASRHIAKKLYRNLSEEDVDKLADIADDLDKVFTPKINKLTNSVLVDIKTASEYSQLCAKLLSANYVSLIGYNAMHHLIEAQKTACYALCKDPNDEASRREALRLDLDDIARIHNTLNSLTLLIFDQAELVTKSSDFTTFGIVDIVQSTLDLRELYPIADKVNLNLRLNSPEKNWIETQKAIEQKKIEEFENERAKYTKKSSRRTIKQIALAS